MKTTAMYDLLTCARDGGSAYDAIVASGGVTLIDAEARGWVQILDATAGVDWVVWEATETQQRVLRLELTDAGRAELERAA